MLAGAKNVRGSAPIYGPGVGVPYKDNSIRFSVGDAKESLRVFAYERYAHHVYVEKG